MRSFHEFVENRNESLLNEYIKYCLDNNLEIDEGLLDTFKKYGKSALVAAAPFVAGGMMAPKAGAMDFSAKNLPANIHDIRNAPDSNPNDYKFQGGDWVVQQSGKQVKFSPSAIKAKLQNLERDHSGSSAHWNNETKNFTVHTPYGKILTYDLTGKLINTTEANP